MAVGGTDVWCLNQWSQCSISKDPVAGYHQHKGHARAGAAKLEVGEELPSRATGHRGMLRGIKSCC